MIARFRLDGAPLAAGSVVIIDEISQVSTRDAHAVVGAVSATPGVSMWCLGTTTRAGRSSLADWPPSYAWNTTPALTGEEHGNVVIDSRDPAEQVLAAVARIPERRIAAVDDPIVLDRQLRAERADHERALTDAPPEVSAMQARLTATVERREQEAKRLWDDLGRLDQQIAKTGGLRQVLPNTRRAPPRAGRRPRRPTPSSKPFRSSCAASVPWATAPDQRSTSTRGGCVPTSGARPNSTASTSNSPSTGRTPSSSPSAKTTPSCTASTGSEARATLAGPCAGHADRDLSAVDDALARERLGRVRAITAGADVPEHISERLGPRPCSGAARDVWLGLAYQLEDRLDRGLRLPTATDCGALSISDRLAGHGSTDPLSRPHSLIAAASGERSRGGAEDPDRWLAAVEHAAATQRDIDQQRRRELDHDLGISL